MTEMPEPKLDCVPHFRRRYDAFRYSIPMAGVKAFDDHRRNAKKRGIEFLFTLPEWWAWWQIDGRWEQRGMGRDALVMARRGDAGPYSPENVYCATHSENGRDVGPSGGRIAAREAIRKLAGTGALRRPK